VIPLKIPGPGHDPCRLKGTTSWNSFFYATKSTPRFDNLTRPNTEWRPFNQCCTHYAVSFCFLHVQMHWNLTSRHLVKETRGGKDVFGILLRGIRWWSLRPQ
jgi:hypothetical protein